MITQEMAQMELQRRSQQKEMMRVMAAKELQKRQNDYTHVTDKILPFGLSKVYQGASDIVSDPARSAKVAIAGLGRTGEGLENLAAKASKLSNPFADMSNVNTEQKNDYKNLLGIRGEKKGDALLEALPALAFPELKAAEGAGALEYLATKGLEGGLYGKAMGDDPLTGALTGIGAGTLAARKSIIAGMRNIKPSIKNKILSHLSSEADKGRAFTPEETQENILRNYLDKEKNPLSPDIGSATGNSGLSNIYQISSHIPFSGGKNQRSLLKKALRKAEEEKFYQENLLRKKDLESDLNEALKIAPSFENENVMLNDQANAALEHSKNIDNKVIPKLEKQYASANNMLNELAPEGSIEGAKSLTESLRNSFSFEKAKDSANYKRVNDFNQPLVEFADPQFFPEYEKSYRKFSPQSEGLKSIFGDDTDLGIALSKELKRGKKFLGDEKPFHIIDLIEDSPAENQTSLGAILSHARALQRVGAAAKDAGRRTEASGLFSMASSLKKDAKNILRSTGNEKVANDLEFADKYYQSNILPFYEKPEIRNTVLSQRHTPNAVKLSKELHEDNQFNILNKLPVNAKNASLNQILTKGLGTSKGKANFETDQIRRVYDSLPAITKSKIEHYKPGTEQYFDHLKDTKNAIVSNKELSKHKIAVANASFSKIKKNQDVLSQAQKIKNQIEKNTEEKESFLRKKYKSPAIGMAESSSLFGDDVVNALKKTGSTALELGILGTGSLLFPKSLGTLGILGATGARATNKLLTDPELLQKYISGKKFTKRKSALLPRRSKAVRLGRILNENNTDDN